MHVSQSGLSEILFWESPTEKKLYGFSSLKPGFHYGEGVVISKQVILAATRLHQAAKSYGFKETDAYPGLGGEARITIYEGSDYLQFTLSESGKIEFYQEKDGKEAGFEEGLSYSDAIEKLLEVKNTLWPGSELSTFDSMTFASRDSKVPFSKKWATEYLSLREDAPWVSLKQSDATCASIMVA